MHVTVETLGAWVIKCNPAVTDFGSLLRSGEPIRTWCVANNYRAAMMDTGQLALLWVSGPNGAQFARGIWGVGQVRAPAEAVVAESSSSRRTTRVAQLDIPMLAAPITAGAISGVAELGKVEVIRQPFAPNPSWVSRGDLAVLEPMLRSALARTRSAG